ncbi:pyrimidine/purine nucleoside phosphorylase [Paenibacillus hodogayensis]|uniref:Pyrimidine/purine nucleoside phosphorylase n=1 Tax=Paenibacillus hodogayensis TaxID=279208 RepID=A0ABV5VRY4_9BACL
MSQFNNVSVATKANVYFDGGVTSRTVWFADGSKKTLGLMLPGVYEFTTDTVEIMEFTSGSLLALLPGETEWKPFEGGTQFEVPAHATFKMDVKTVTDYVCSFITGS